MADIPLSGDQPNQNRPTHSSASWTSTAEAAAEAASLFSATSASSIGSSLSSRSASSASSIYSVCQLPAAEFIDLPRFHQSLTVPATSSHGELKVTYAVAGCHDESAPTLLFVGGMFGGRYLATFVDFLGQKYGVRVIAVDRPGMGGSTPVEPSQRIQVWLETVPILMEEVKAKHVALAAHSCGVIYAFNTVYHMPQILSPHAPSLYLFSPWVHHQQSNVKLMSVASSLPSALIRRFDRVISFINTRIAPPISFSSTVVSTAALPFAKAISVLRPKAAAQCREDDEKAARKIERISQIYYGVSSKEYSARATGIMPRIFKEDTTGANGEALLALRKGREASWGICDDYKAFVPQLDQKMKDFFWNREPMKSPVRAKFSHRNSLDRREVIFEDKILKPKLRVKTFWAEKDIMVGKGGERYFDSCFDAHRKHHDSNGEDLNPDSCIDYVSTSISGTDHESICMLQSGVFAGVMKDVWRTLLFV